MLFCCKIARGFCVCFAGPDMELMKDAFARVYFHSRITNFRGPRKINRAWHLGLHKELQRWRPSYPSSLCYSSLVLNSELYNTENYMTSVTKYERYEFVCLYYCVSWNYNQNL